MKTQASKGINLELFEDGTVDVKPEKQVGPECITGQCEYAANNWQCLSSNENIWDVFRDPGWCPLGKWFRGSKHKEFYAHQREIERKRKRQK